MFSATKLSSLVLLLAISPFSYADLLGDEDDNYLGMQITIPVTAGSKQKLIRQSQFNLIAVSQQAGIINGAVLTLDRSSNQTWSLVRPSSSLDISGDNLPQYLLPLVTVSSEEHGEISSSFNGTDLLLYTICGAYLVGDVISNLIHSPKIVRDEEAEESESSESN